MHFIIILLLLGSSVSLNDQRPRQSPLDSCPHNEILNSCASCDPEPTCQVPKPYERPCPRNCNPRCECDKRRGYIRDEISNLCVHKKSCPTHPKCGQFEIFNICGSNCFPEPTFQNPNRRLTGSCIQSCKQRCDCDAYRGYIRDEVTGLCSRPESCDVDLHPNATVLECSNNEILKKCDTCLPEPSCRNPHPEDPGLRLAYCFERCECNKTSGLIRDELTGQCIPKDQCFSCNRSNQRLGCMSCCNSEDIPTCRNPQPDLTCNCSVCIRGCVCADGFVLNEYTGECVLQYDCPAL